MLHILWGKRARPNRSVGDIEKALPQLHLMRIKYPWNRSIQLTLQDTKASSFSTVNSPRCIIRVSRIKTQHWIHTGANYYLAWRSLFIVCCIFLSMINKLTKLHFNIFSSPHSISSGIDRQAILLVQFSALTKSFAFMAFKIRYKGL